MHAAALACTGKVNSFGWLRYSGFVRHKEPQLDAAGALADLLVFAFNLTGLDILAKIESQMTCKIRPGKSSLENASLDTVECKSLLGCACFRWEYRLLFKARDW